MSVSRVRENRMHGSMRRRGAPPDPAALARGSDRLPPPLQLSTPTSRAILARRTAGFASYGGGAVKGAGVIGLEGAAGVEDGVVWRVGAARGAGRRDAWSASYARPRWVSGPRFVAASAV